MNRILIQFAHPALQRSRVNKVLVERIKSLDGITFNDLYDTYPDFDIDVQREQQLLVEHDIIIFQHPFFWYSPPAILKEWLDLVLEHGWAYGHEGKALRGKKYLQTITAGGGERAYQKDGFARYTIRELTAPMEQSMFLCGLEYLPPFIIYGTHLMEKDEINAHAADYSQFLAALRDEQIDIVAAKKHDRINYQLNDLILRG